LTPAVTVIGGGPAGSTAAIVAAAEGSAVHIVEKSRMPRHKVCGEFLSPEIVPLLEQLGIRFFDANPARIRRLLIRFRSREKTALLPEIAYGLSRFAFDAMLFEKARSVTTCDPVATERTVIAHGRRSGAPRGRRLFGFKAHFSGPATDAIELHFFDGGYVGINAVENGTTNVCGLATESALAPLRFEYDELLGSVPSIAARIRPLRREMDWITTGPLIFANRFKDDAAPATYYAGDALSFVDPFTGSGMYCAVLTGMLAGRAAARGTASEEHVRLCRQALGRPFAFAALFRNAITSGWAEHIAPFVPARLLFRLTRP
jgi:flavin-dependent dehydrogenase